MIIILLNRALHNIKEDLLTRFDVAQFDFMVLYKC